MEADNNNEDIEPIATENDKDVMIHIKYKNVCYDIFFTMSYMCLLRRIDHPCDGSNA